MLRHIDRQNLRVAFAFLIGLAAYLALITYLQGCFPVRVDPPTEGVCGSRENCGLCASESVCVWCPGAGPSGACIGSRSGPERCDVETVISVPEMCEGAVGE